MNCELASGQVDNRESISSRGASRRERLREIFFFYVPSVSVTYPINLECAPDFISSARIIGIIYDPRTIEIREGENGKYLVKWNCNRKSIAAEFPRIASKTCKNNFSTYRSIVDTLSRSPSGIKLQRENKKQNVAQNKNIRTHKNSRIHTCNTYRQSRKRLYRFY